MSAPPHLFLHRLLRPPPAFRSSPSASLFSLFLTCVPPHAPSISSTCAFTSLSCGPLFILSSPLCLSINKPSVSSPLSSLSTSQKTDEPELHDQDVDGDEDDDFESEYEHDVGPLEEAPLNSSSPKRATESVAKFPSLTVKEKKELASYAHSLGKKLKSQQVGKSGVTDSVATALIETLEANELLKLKIHNTCPGELEDVVKQLEGATGSVVVGQIGRTVILYRPSVTKLKAEEKRKETRRVFRRKQLAFKSSFENKGQLPRTSGRGRRGSSRFSSSS